PVEDVPRTRARSAAVAHQWLDNIVASMVALDSLFSHFRFAIREMSHAMATTAHILFSFEALVIVSFLSFAVLGTAITISVVWPLLVERDDYDDCENGVYYPVGCDKYGNNRGAYVGVMLPLVLEVDREGTMNIFQQGSPARCSSSPKSSERRLRGGSLDVRIRYVR
ncbi:hypothetical protein C8J57DRAFT_1369043, partial [Mycena rebaudengoi]